VSEYIMRFLNITSAHTRRAAVSISFVVHVIQYVPNLNCKGRFSIGWFMLVARVVRAHFDFCTSCGQTQWFFAVL